MPILGGSATASTVETATDNGVTITVTSENDSARLAIDLEGGTVDEPVYVLRRDRNGTTMVRPTSAGTVLWVAGTPTTVPTIYEYEARQGLETDYIVTDLDGTPLVSVRFVVPEWGAWLKNVGKPHMNMSIIWKDDSAFDREVQTSVLQPRGAKFPIVLSDRRTAPAGRVVVQTSTDEEARALTSLLGDGQPLMVDVPDSWGVPIRYVMAGGMVGSRLPGPVFITEDTRVWHLDLTEIAAPVGLPAGQDFTYTGMSALADSYIALGAIFATYDDMALGLES